MSNVPESKRSESKCTAVLASRTLATYTAQICSNDKKFAENLRPPVKQDPPPNKGGGFKNRLTTWQKMWAKVWQKMMFLEKMLLAPDKKARTEYF